MMDEGLLTVANVMTPTTLSLTTLDAVVTAAEIIRREGLGGLPVMEGDRVAGFVTAQQLLAELPYRPVGTVMTRGIIPAAPDLSLLQTYALMTRQGVEVLPIVSDAGVVGQVSITAVLKALGQQTDPLTGLPWATALRAWATAALARGREVTILFIDLDNFGEVNKALGHVAGDDILRSIARLLGSLADPGTDLLCRYGGDEFAIATTRHEEATRALLEQIHNTIVLPVDIGGARSNVTSSVGVAGGRRREGRTPAHVPATVEELLVQASRASTAVKEAKGLPAQGDPRAVAAARGIEPAAVEVPAPATPPGVAPGAGTVPGPGAAEARLRLMDVAVHAGERGTVATVTLQLGRRGGIGRAASSVHGRGILFLVADATLAAIRRTIGEQHAYVLEELTEVPTGKDTLVVTVLSDPGSGPKGYVGAVRTVDPHRAVAKAVLDALNRPLARTLAEFLREDTTP